MSENPYPRIAELGIRITPASDQDPPGISGEEVNGALIRAGLSVETFGRLFGVQTCGPNGLYPWDVEAVLERMMSGKKTGTQLVWD